MLPPSEPGSYIFLNVFFIYKCSECACGGREELKLSTMGLRG